MKSKPKLTVEEFVLLAIEKLRNPGYKGIHAVYSQFNEGFRDYFPGLDPVKEIDKLHVEGKIVKRMARGGPMLYLPQDAPPQAKGGNALKKMGL